MNLNHLRVFAAIARSGTFTGAAKLLRVSQPAVSKQLGELETAVGLTLFDRVPGGARLTDAGEILQRQTDRIFEAEAAAEADLAALAGLSRGRLRVGASTTIGSYLIPQLLGDFRRSHPEVELELQIANTNEIQRALLAGQLDLAMTEGFVGSGALEVAVVHTDQLVVIVAPEHAWAKSKRATLRALAEAPFIAREHGSGTRAVVEAALAEHGVTVDPVMTLGSTEAVKSAVAAGLGVAMVSRLTVALELSSRRLVEVRTPGLSVRRSLHLLTHRHRQPSPAASAFLALLSGPRSGLRT
ncbi:MAG: LysR family transcriptional regulator [Nannocystaceae bacterium]|nr:LysR family transcriptional regulator [Nannocystaceae bacterium]